MIGADEALRILAAHGLPGAPEEPLVVDSLDGLLAGASAHRVLPHVLAAVRAGRVTNATDEWVAELRRRAMDDAGTTLATQAAAVIVVRRLREEGIEPIVLKGVATAHLDHRRPADRPTSDVDILVGLDELTETRTILSERTPTVSHGDQWSIRFGHAVNLSGPDIGDVDVHVRLAPGYVGLSIPPSDLRERPAPFEIGGTPMRALDGPNRLIHAAVHSRRDDLRLHPRRDVPQLVLVSGIDWEEAVRRAIAWRIDHFFAVGVQVAWASFAVPDHPLVEWARTHRPTGRSRLTHLVGGTRPRGQRLAAPIALPPSQWVPYVWPQLFPSRRYVDAHHRGWRVRARILRGELTRGRPS